MLYFTSIFDVDVFRVYSQTKLRRMPNGSRLCMYYISVIFSTISVINYRVYVCLCSTSGPTARANLRECWIDLQLSTFIDIHFQLSFLHEWLSKESPTLFPLVWECWVTQAERTFRKRSRDSTLLKLFRDPLFNLGCCQHPGCWIRNKFENFFFLKGQVNSLDRTFRLSQVRSPDVCPQGVCCIHWQ